MQPKSVCVSVKTVQPQRSKTPVEDSSSSVRAPTREPHLQYWASASDVPVSHGADGVLLRTCNQSKDHITTEDKCRVAPTTSTSIPRNQRTCFLACMTSRGFAQPCPAADGGYLTLHDCKNQHLCQQHMATQNFTHVHIHIYTDSRKQEQSISSEQCLAT